MSDDGKLGSLLFLSGCILAVWSIAFSSTSDYRESFHTGFTVKYAKTSDMETQTDPAYFFEPEDAPLPDSFENNDLYCNHGECKRIDNQQQPDTSIDQKQEEPVVESVKTASFNHDMPELPRTEEVRMNSFKNKISVGDPFNLEKNLKLYHM